MQVELLVLPRATMQDRRMGPVLLERDQELNRLRSSLAEAAGGHGSAVLLFGEAGVGKIGLLWRYDRDPYERAVQLLDSREIEPSLEALAVFDELGAKPAALLARQRLRELGVRQVPRGPQAATRANPAGLTGRQLEIFGLLADGLTNAEIAARLVVSIRTVDHHVSAVLQKLNVPTRREAAEQAARLTAE